MGARVSKAGPEAGIGLGTWPDRPVGVIALAGRRPSAPARRDRPSLRHRPAGAVEEGAAPG
eukprot:15454155-Alexandrium_andersonii.AAC.1